VILITGKKNFFRMKVGIVDYGTGNIFSVFNSIYNLGYDPVIIDKNTNIDKVDRLIVPGVGSANQALINLRKNEFLDKIKKFYEKGKPVLGVCLGFQIFAKKLLEDGNSEGIGLINGIVKPIQKPNAFNIGWCKVKINADLSNKIRINSISDFYFCHSYYLDFNQENGTECYGTTFFKKEIPSIILKDNFIGVQFHPEKSQINGIKFIKYFINWNI